MGMKRLYVASRGAVAGAGGVVARRRGRRPRRRRRNVATTKAQISNRPRRRSRRRRCGPTSDYIDAVRSANPSVPATPPAEYPVDLNDGAQVVLHDSSVIDPLGHLWIARADAPADERGVRRVDHPSREIRDVPLFAHWWVNDTGSGEWAGRW